MFDSIQQQAGMTLLRTMAKEASRGALPYPEEPVPFTDRDTHPGWLRLQARRLTTRFNRVRLGQARPVTPAGKPLGELGSTAESIQG